MIRITNRELKRYAVSVTAGAARRVVGSEFAFLEIPKWTSPFGTITPSANPDHFVEGFPAGECIVRGVHANKTAAIFHILLECFFQIGRPAIIGGIVVKYHVLV